MLGECKYLNSNFKARVGKTSTTIRFCQNTFDEHQASTINAGFLEQHVRVADPKVPSQTKMYKLAIWDTAGQEIHHSLNKIYYRGAHGRFLLINYLGALIVYDITDVDSFDRMKHWIVELRQ